MMKKTFVFSVLMLLLVSFAAHSEDLNTGPWRFELRATYANVPFVIHISKSKNNYIGTLKNGKEEIRLTGIQVDKKKVIIPLQTYETTLEMELPQDGKMTGYLIRHNKNPISKTPVFAAFGESERFPEEKSKPTIDLNGKWAITMTDEEGKKEQGVLLFEQKGNELYGSILSPTGDYRYIEGFVSDHEFEGASFDGSYNYLLKGRVTNGTLKAGILANWKMNIEGKKDPNAALPDAYKQTQVTAMSFEFPDLSGKKVSLKDHKFKNKPVIVQFFGSWCPNCLDEMNYLIPWYHQNHKRGIEIVALAFERSLTPADAKKQLFKVQKQKHIPYTLLIAGSTSEEKPNDKIPGLKNFISFPTTVFLNKKHEVVKVHTGFTGPSTGEYYEKWKKEFNETVNGLLK